jgi:7-cyano-7-deazaguanine synthase
MGNIVLLSSGLDSTVNLAECIKKNEDTLALTFDYGQKSAKKEIEFSKKICRYYKIKHIILEVPYFKKFSRSSLLKENLKIPFISEKDLKNRDKLLKSRDRVWVPNRNALFINIAACIAESLKIKYIVVGFNKEEAETFPDNSKNFLKAMNKTLSYSTLNKVKVKSYTLNLTKKEILKRGIKLNIPFQYLWVCYNGGKNFCWECESCIRFKNVIEDFNLKIWRKDE